MLWGTGLQITHTHRQAHTLVHMYACAHAHRHTHMDRGMIASKYVETLQRSNEQMVKLAALIQKKESKTDGLSSVEKEEIYDLLNSEAKEEDE